MSSINEDLLKAIDLALANKWDAAHDIVQQYEGNDTASWIHAVLHKIEGDDGNSRYWYRRANRPDDFAKESRAELMDIRAKLSSISS